jgi:hypothetical protein
VLSKREEGGEKWMEKFFSLFTCSMCIIGFVNSMAISYKYGPNLKVSLFSMVMGLVCCMAFIYQLKEYFRER